MSINVRRNGEVLVISLANPPVNTISVTAGVIAGLSGAFELAMADDSVTGVIVCGEGKLFCGGADIKEFAGDPARLDALRDTLNRIEASGKPVVMALHGMALGGGLELALAGHYRIAAPGTQLALPEVTLGVLPGGGGTQRLPRLIGARKAIAMMLDGKPVTAEAALALGLIDEIAEGELTQAALAFLQDGKPAIPHR